MAPNTEQLIREVIDLTPLLRSKIIRPMETCAGKRIAPGQLNILTILTERGPKTMAQLGQEMIVCRQQMTQLIESLVQKGFVAKKADRLDRRTVRVNLTEEGERYIRDVNADMTRELYPIFDGYTDEQKRNLIKTAKAMREIMMGETGA